MNDDELMSSRYGYGWPDPRGPEHLVDWSDIFDRKGESEREKLEKYKREIEAYRRSIEARPVSPSEKVTKPKVKPKKKAPKKPKVVEAPEAPIPGFPEIDLD